MNNDETTMTLEEILAEMYDFSDYSEEERTTMISDTSSMIAEAALLRSLESAEESTQEAFDALMETNPHEDQLMEFVNNNLPTFQDILSEEIHLFHSMNEAVEETTKE